MKRFSYVLALLLVFSFLLPIAASAVDTAPPLNPEYPTIYIVGQGQKLGRKAGTWSETDLIYPVDVDSDYIMEQAKLIAPALTKAAVTDNWTEYNDAVYNAVAPLFAEVMCNNNGEVTEGSGSIFQNVGIKEPKVYNASQIWGMDLIGYGMNYDWRLDPYELAKQLRSMIVKITTQQKAEKVNIVARCLGANIVLAYLDLYGEEDLMLNKVIMYSGGYDGFELFGELFSGEIDLDADSIEAFSNAFLQSGEYANDETFELIRALISYTNKIAALDTLSFVVNRGYKDVKDDLMPRILLDTIANMPSFWSYVGDEYYERAKQFIFSGKEEQYAKLIEKTDKFHYNVLNRSKELMKKAEEKNVEWYIFAKYGFAMLPISSKYEGVNTDTFVALQNTSLGATSSGLFKTFDKKYLSRAEENGTAKYIAPDLQVDASTCMYPERTWFIKNLEHRTMPECVNPLINFVIMQDSPTVFSSEEFPQYLVVNDEATEMTPMTAENGATQNKGKMSFWETLKSLFNNLIKLLKSFFQSLTKK